MRIVNLNEQKKKNILENLLKRSPNNYDEFEGRVKSILEEYAEDNELNYEQNLTLNHISRFKRYKLEDAEEIFQKLQDDFGLRDKVAAHIVDLVPQDLADMRVIFAKEPSSIEKEEMESILKMLEDYDIQE